MALKAATYSSLFSKYSLNILLNREAFGCLKAYSNPFHDTTSFVRILSLSLSSLFFCPSTSSRLLSSFFEDIIQKNRTEDNKDRLSYYIISCNRRIGDRTVSRYAFVFLL